MHISNIKTTLGKDWSYFHPVGRVKEVIILDYSDNKDWFSVIPLTYPRTRKEWLMHRDELPNIRSVDDIIEASMYEESSDGHVADIKFIKLLKQHKEEKQCNK